ncbi:MAG: recombinase family protein, partial [Selenomonadaceae bacterium]
MFDTPGDDYYHIIMDIVEILNKISYSLQAGKTPALAYDRISSEGQTEGMSLSYQEDSARRYADYMKLDIIHTFAVVESARKEGRKTFNAMVDTALACGIKHIIFKNTDRMSRNYSDLVRLEKLIDNEGFNIHFYQNNRIINKESNHNDRFILGIELAVAKHISDKISHDIKESCKFKAKSGIAPCPCPYGYSYDMKKKRFIINLKMEPVVRQFFDEFDNGEFSLEEYCRHLNSCGIGTPKGFSQWRKQDLHRVLTNPFYHGEFRYKGTIWEGTQEKYYDKKRYMDRITKLKEGGNGRETKHDFALNGLLRCGCGYAFYGAHVKNKYIYYIHNCPTAGKQVSIMEGKAIKSIGLAVSGYLLDDATATALKEVFALTISEKSENIKNELSGMTRQISEIRTKKKRLFDLYADEGIDREVLNESIKE